MPSVDAAECVRGRVLRVHGLASVVETDDGRLFRCAVRRLLKSLATDERSVVTTGDMVWIRPARSGDRGQETGSKKQRTGDRGQETAIEKRNAGEAGDLCLLSPVPCPLKKRA